MMKNSSEGSYCEPLKKSAALTLLKDLIVNTDYWENLKAYKEECKSPVDKLCDKYYTGFMSRKEAILRHHKTKIKEVKKCTRATEENVAMMYENVYEGMVEAAVAVRFKVRLSLRAVDPLNIN
jgi:hypothetical protein